MKQAYDNQNCQNYTFSGLKLKSKKTRVEHGNSEKSLRAIRVTINLSLLERCISVGKMHFPK